MYKVKTQDRAELRRLMILNEWTPESLKRTRLMLGLNTNDISAVLGVSRPVVSNIEKGINANYATMQLYGIVLERYWAYQHGYVPAYRKIGQNDFVNMDILSGGDDAVKANAAQAL